MRVRDMNVHQKAMYLLMDEATKDFIGGYENTMEDREEGSDEYKEASDFLSLSHEALVDFFYSYVMNQCKAGEYASHARFAGGDFLRERIENRLVKWGY